MEMSSVPICLVPFTREQIIDGKVVTLEHVPPKFMGGSARCLTCKICNAETGRDIDQLAATTEQDVKVTVDIQGKKDSFYITLDGKERTPAFGGFTREDIRNTKELEIRTIYNEYWNSKSGSCSHVVAEGRLLGDILFVGS